jgi:hypothetical protein
LSIVGLALLATEMRPLARLLDRIEILVRASLGRFRVPGHTAKRVLVVVGALVAMASLARLANGLFR